MKIYVGYNSLDPTASLFQIFN